MSRLRKRSLAIAGHRTSVSLEAPFWDCLKALAAAEGLTLRALVERIDQDREGNLSSALRCHVVQRLLEKLAAAEAGTSG